ncbi:hypothetical protein BHM03_00029297 [Ensete ventricosum]|nr:hypothetical protein BHM03_00029297 [Ensete ventricosum]
MQWDLTGGSLGDSPKESRSSLGTRWEIIGRRPKDSSQECRKLSDWWDESSRCRRARGGHLHAVYMQRWLAMARPPVRAVGHGLVTCKGAAYYGQGPLQRGGARPWPNCRGNYSRVASCSSMPAARS